MCALIFFGLLGDGFLSGCFRFPGNQKLLVGKVPSLICRWWAGREGAWLLAILTCPELIPSTLACVANALITPWFPGAFHAPSLEWSNRSTTTTTTTTTTTQTLLQLNLPPAESRMAPRLRLRLCARSNFIAEHLSVSATPSPPPPPIRARTGVLSPSRSASEANLARRWRTECDKSICLGLNLYANLE